MQGLSNIADEQQQTALIDGGYLEEVANEDIQ